MRLNRREFIQTAGAGAAGVGLAARALGQPAPRPQEIDALFDRAIVVDTLSQEKWDTDGFAALKRSGYTAIQTTLSSGAELTKPGGDAALPYWSEGNFDIAMRALEEWRERIRQHPDTFIHCTRASHIEQAKREGKLAVILGFQNAPVQDSVDTLDKLFAAGARCIQLTYNSRNNLGDGCLERLATGLSDFGIACVERMDELGMIVDLSHCGEGTTSDGIAFARRPTCTHTFCQALHFHPRGKSDSLLRAIGRKDGMVGIASLGYFVKNTADASLEDYISHIDHAVKVAGIDHVGVSTDYAIRGIEVSHTRETWLLPRVRSYKPSYAFRWPPWIPELDKPERFRYVAHALVKRGYRATDVEKILGGNWVAYLRDVFKG